MTEEKSRGWRGRRQKGFEAGEKGEIRKCWLKRKGDKEMLAEGRARGRRQKEFQAGEKGRIENAGSGSSRIKIEAREEENWLRAKAVGIRG